MRRLLLALASAAALLLTSVTPAGAATPRLQCGQTISGTVVLTANLTCPAVGFVLGPDVTLDLGGHTLKGPGTGAGVALQAGPDFTGTVTVKNGRLVNWAQGIGENDNGSTVTKASGLTVSSVATFVGEWMARTEIDRSQFVNSGFGFFWGGTVVVRDSTFRGGSGFNAGPSVPQLTIERSVLDRAPIVGSCTDGGQITVNWSLVRGTGSGTGIAADTCRVTAQYSTFRGFGSAITTYLWVASGSNGLSVFLGNVFVGNQTALDIGARASIRANTFTSNGIGVLSSRPETPVAPEDILLDRNVFTRNGDGARIDTLVHASNNLATHNTRYGLYLPQAVDGGGNVAVRNGTNCVGVMCTRP